MNDWKSLPSLRGCRIEGKDAIAFCQSQLTGDVPAWPAERWQVTAWCSPKGRVRIIMVAARHENHVEIIIPEAQWSVLSEMQRFTIGRDVRFGPACQVSGCQDSNAQSGTLRQDPSRALRLEDTEATAGSVPETDWLTRWQRADLCLPLPWLDERSSDRFLPQALGLEENEGLSYRKGCYPGQEIVARVHYLGTPPQQLLAVRAELSQGAWPASVSPDSVEIEASDADSTPIHCLSALVDEGRWMGLVVAPRVIEAGQRVVVRAGSEALVAEMARPETLCYHHPQTGS
ncbi:CAF17-like 4Fe-4S cluster assembly/insertion protein YgfZ [Wenzhouxiangella marina]|uniref:Uncharacterized protein n=1 Tax=Wenzhouxiangella marina TaxID=1579979 RepID=A0A0K0XX09_9GAMM|nr:folate-binding protein YgfZ [Wenzhouxiangella marina]AKS42182.1 hypothetical protein WM2015_1815 [Wenzhouxiangella marina]MBB6086046.1 hypothetical protein [Wenzhouxiangella marina]